ncbi:MAG: hypothetical protein LBE59_06335 [Nevskiaceae bacterium]|jgi:hypothetical protein|nr:hypothetical protein [Nevskiaceae bacterium]
MKSLVKGRLLGVVAALLVGGVALAPTPALAQVGRVAPVNVGSGDCDRACLIDLAEKVIAAMVAHDPSKLPLAKNAKYSENGVELPIPDGFFYNATKAGTYRMYVVDPDWGSIGVFAKVEENHVPSLLTTRLRVYNRQIVEIESIVGKEFRTRDPNNIQPDVLGDAPRPEFTTIVPPEKRRSREELMKIVNTYFTGIENNVGKKPPIFSSKCHRLENGAATSNVPVPPGGQRSSRNYTCIQGIANGYHRNDNRLRNRRIMAVDVERQVVLAAVYFDHLNDERIRTYTANDGTPVRVNDTSPATLNIHEAFQIDEEGISQVEAIMTTVPYGMRPYFSTGFQMDSEQTRIDGFIEYE